MSNPLTSCVLFEGVPEALAWPLISDRPTMHLAAGQVLLSPHAHNQSLYIVSSGSFSIRLESPEQPSYRTVGPGQLVGEISLLRRCRPTAYVIAEEPSVVLALSDEELQSLVGKEPRICRNLMTMLAETVAHNTQRAIAGQQRIADLEALTQRDPLTGLFNRAWFDDELRRLCESRADGGPVFSLILLDIDEFHQYNERHGHLGGDLALIALAGTLAAKVRPSDAVARYGGEELAVLLPDTRLASATIVAERLLLAVRAMRVQASEDETLSPLTISLGLAECMPNCTPAELIRDADTQLYRAKQQGRNRLCLSGDAGESEVL